MPAAAAPCFALQVERRTSERRGATECEGGACVHVCAWWPLLGCAAARTPACLPRRTRARVEGAPATRRPPLPRPLRPPAVRRVVKLVRALRKGWISREAKPQKPQAYLIWEEDGAHCATCLLPLLPLQLAPAVAVALLPPRRPAPLLPPPALCPRRPPHSPSQSPPPWPAPTSSWPCACWPCWPSPSPTVRALGGC